MRDTENNHRDYGIKQNLDWKSLMLSILLIMVMHTKLVVVAPRSETDISKFMFDPPLMEYPKITWIVLLSFTDTQKSLFQVIPAWNLCQTVNNVCHDTCLGV